MCVAGSRTRCDIYKAKNDETARAERIYKERLRLVAERQAVVDEKMAKLKKEYRDGQEKDIERIRHLLGHEMPLR